MFLASSVSRAYDSESWGDEFEPHIWYRDYFKKKQQIVRVHFINIDVSFSPLSPVLPDLFLDGIEALWDFIQVPERWYSRGLIGFFLHDGFFFLE